jgi:hypothetical protein
MQAATPLASLPSRPVPAKSTALATAHLLAAAARLLTGRRALAAACLLARTENVVTTSHQAVKVGIRRLCFAGLCCVVVIMVAVVVLIVVLGPAAAPA